MAYVRLSDNGDLRWTCQSACPTGTGARPRSSVTIGGRPRPACSGCERLHQAPLPPRLIQPGGPLPGLLAHVLASKHCDHLPHYRQSRIFARGGIQLDRSTLAGWVGKATALLEPRVDAIGATCWPARPCSPTTPRSSCWCPGSARRRPGGPGPTSGTSDRGAAARPMR